MLEDIDHDGSHGIYKQQPPLLLPPMNNSMSVHATVSPRFESLLTRSVSSPWSPTRVDETRYDRAAAEPLSTNHINTKSPDMWPNNSPYSKSSDGWAHTNNRHPKTPDMWTNNENAHPKPSDVFANNYPYTKSFDVWPNNSNNVHPKSPDIWTNNNHNNGPPKTSEIWSNTNAPPKTAERWSPNNTFTKGTESAVNSNSSSNAQMVKSLDKKPGYFTDRCSPRCKLGTLGFIIGFLAVGIAVAVVLVLWLRQ